MSWFNINLGEIASIVKARLPQPCTAPPAKAVSVVRRADHYKSQSPSRAVQAAVPKKMPPITSNFKRVKPASAEPSAKARTKTQAAETPVEKAPVTEKATDTPVNKESLESGLRKAAEENDHRAFFTQLQKKPSLLNQKDELGRTPLDLMPQSRRKTELYGRVKHVLKDDVLIWESARQGDHLTFFNVVKKKPGLLTQTDELGRTPLDLMPESARKTELYERMKPMLLKGDHEVFVDAPIRQHKFAWEE